MNKYLTRLTIVMTLIIYLVVCAVFVGAPIDQYGHADPIAYAYYTGLAFVFFLIAWVICEPLDHEPN